MNFSLLYIFLHVEKFSQIQKSNHLFGLYFRCRSTRAMILELYIGLLRKMTDFFIWKDTVNGLSKYREDKFFLFIYNNFYIKFQTVSYRIK